MKSISTLLRLNRHLIVGSVVVAAVTGFAATAQAQSPPPALQTSPAAEPMKAERNSRSVARTGATVPNPGTAKTGPQTEVERRAHERSGRTVRTICSGCL
jgi:predicted phage-related endonuclease